MNRIIGMLKAAGLCSDVLYKELYISQKEIDSAPTVLHDCETLLPICTAICKAAFPFIFTLLMC